MGGYFESGTLVRYDFMADSGSLPVAKGSSGTLSSEGNLTEEELSFSFSTSNSPSVLVYISSRTQDYMAVVLRRNGELVMSTGNQSIVKGLFCILSVSILNMHTILSISVLSINTILSY